MEDVDKEYQSIIESIFKFSVRSATLGLPIADDRLDKFEKEISYKLPLDFRYLLSRHNGIFVQGTEVYGLDDALRSASLDRVYKAEHYKVAYPMPEAFLPFSNDGRGNHYCLYLSKINNGICPVVFWQWDFDYKSIDEVEICNNNFFEWIREVMIEWNVDDEGHER